jgi:hypothetical protein
VFLGFIPHLLEFLWGVVLLVGVVEGRYPWVAKDEGLGLWVVVNGVAVNVSMRMVVIPQQSHPFQQVKQPPVQHLLGDGNSAGVVGPPRKDMREWLTLFGIKEQVVLGNRVTVPLFEL